MYLPITWKVKLCLLITGLLVLTILGAGILLIRSEKDALYALIKNQGETLVRDLAQTSAQPLLNEDDLMLNSLLRNAGQKKYVKAAFIVDNQGTIRAHSDVGFTGVKFTPPVEFKGSYEAQHRVFAQPRVTPEGIPIIYFLHPILYSDVRLGSVHLELSQNVINTAIQEAIHRIVVFLIIVIIFGSVASLGLASLISTPIYRLIEGTKEIAEGNYKHRLPVKFQDEMGILTTAFNSMAQNLQHKEQVEWAFGKYVFRQVAELILKDSSVYQGGIKQRATFLFVDIRRFVSLAELIPPEQAVELLNRYSAVLTRVVFEFNGLLDKFMGDGLMAIFGVPPLQEENHAENATRAAIKIRAEIQKLGDQLSQEGKKSVDIGIGITTGEVIARDVGSLESLEYLVVGYEVNMASCLKSIASNGQILLTETIYQEVKDLVEVVSLPPGQVQGCVEPLSLYEVKGLKP